MEKDIYQKITNLLHEGKEAALVTVISVTGSTPRKSGSKMLVMRDGQIYGTVGGGKLESLSIEEAKKVMDEGVPKVASFKLTPDKDGIGAVCGGSMEVFIEPVLKAEKIFIFGAGHVGNALSKMARVLELQIHVWDDRAEYASAQNYPEAYKVWNENIDEALSKMPLDERSYIVLINRSWMLDEEILGKILEKKLAYIGLIGSKRKIATHFQNLKARGFSDGQLSRVHAPIGIDIGAYTPAEIAVSILAEIVAVQNGKAKEKKSAKAVK